MELTTILSYARRNGTDQHEAFLTRLNDWLNATAEDQGDNAYTIHDEFATYALVYCRPTANTNTSPILWTAHTDTVHQAAVCTGTAPTNPFNYDEDFDYISAMGQPLGADDGAGVYILCRMIEAGVPGTYIFFTGEEVGGIGSEYVAKHHKPWLEGFKAAVAFDRRGTNDVIYEQGVGQCASETFAALFANVLNEKDTELAYSPSPNGIFTDTANLAHIIPECLNISCGYNNEHSAQESLDVAHLKRLTAALITQFSDPETVGALLSAVSRKPGDFGDRSWGFPSYATSQPGSASTKLKRKSKRSAPRELLVDMQIDDVIAMTYTQLKGHTEAWCKAWAKAQIDGGSNNPSLDTDAMAALIAELSERILDLEGELDAQSQLDSDPDNFNEQPFWNV